MKGINGTSFRNRPLQAKLHIPFNPNSTKLSTNVPRNDQLETSKDTIYIARVHHISAVPGFQNW